jgi:hypothetical protein
VRVGQRIRRQAEARNQSQQPARHPRESPNSITNYIFFGNRPQSTPEKTADCAHLANSRMRGLNGHIAQMEIRVLDSLRASFWAGATNFLALSLDPITLNQNALRNLLAHTPPRNELDRSAGNNMQNPCKFARLAMQFVALSSEVGQRQRYAISVCVDACNATH